MIEGITLGIMRKRGIIVIQYKFVAVVLATALFLMACSGTAQVLPERSAMEGDIAGEIMNNDMENNVFEGDYSIIDTENLFSKRDLSGTYDEETCETITLRDGGSTTGSKGVEISACVKRYQYKKRYIRPDLCKTGRQGVSHACGQIGKYACEWRFIFGN